MHFKRKSKKVFREQSRRKRSRIIKKRTRKFLIKKRHTRKGGMKRNADPYALSDEENDSTKSPRPPDPLEIEILRKKTVDLPPLDNTKIGIQPGEDAFSCILGPDFSISPRYQALVVRWKPLWDKEQREKQEIEQTLSKKMHVKTRKMHVKSTANNDPNKNPYQAFKVIKKNIEDRSGQVRCDLGPYEIFEFPRYRTRNPLQENKRLKFVVVKDENTKEFIILMAYAYMPNHNYTEDYLFKWTNINSEGEISPREPNEGPKNVILITPEIIRHIEAYCIENMIPLEWDSLLMTKSINPNEYNRIVERYFSEMKGISAEDNVFLTSIDEISHSALPNNFRRPIQKIGVVPLVFLGAEGVFYRNAQGKQCFIICNLSGHFKTPANLMNILRLILKYNYGYVNDDVIRELGPTPIASASSSSSQDSDEPRRPDYRDVVTNDPNIRTFEQALRRLNEADTFPIKGPTHPPLSALVSSSL